jgi:hypothetical protein
MDEFGTTSATLDQTDEDILTYTASDGALEAAAAGSLGGVLCTYNGDLSFGWDDEALEAAAGVGGVILRLEAFAADELHG